MAIDYTKKMVCERCGIEKTEEKEFFKRKDGTREPLCKDCLTQHINNKDRTTFEGILEKFDVPYVEDEGIKIYNKEIDQKGKVSSKGVLGKYLRLMKIVQYNKYGYADTEKLNFENNKSKAAIAARAVDKDPRASALLLELQQKLDAGEITQAEFDTRNPITAAEEAQPQFLEFKVAQETLDDEAVLEQLTEEEVNTLKIKWGSTYRPAQGVRMEEVYIKYENQYDLTVDREEALKQICKITVKMDEALAIDDINGYKSLVAAQSDLRKSAKFTDAQNKEDQSSYLNSIGELVRFCEQEKGLIEQMPSPDEYPQDKIDFTIKDIKNYIQTLIRGELGLGDLIESYIKKLEEAEKAKEADLDISLDLDEEDYLTQQEAEEGQQHLEGNIEDEATMLLEMFGDE